jgi:hypothetical protein
MDASPTDADLGDAGAPTAAPVWTADSRRIDVSCFAFSEGSMKFGATRDQLSGAQLELLSQMKRIDGSSTCWEDVMGCEVAVTNGDGSVSSYSSVDMNGACGATSPLISFESFDPFRRTLRCLYAKDDFGVSPDGGTIVAAVPPDPGCLNGLFSGAPMTITRGLDVSDPGVPHHLELDQCVNQYRSPAQLHLQLLDQDGVTSLAEGTAVSDPGPDQACWRLDYTFQSAGTYFMSVAVDAGFQAGDFFFRFY